MQCFSMRKCLIAAMLTCSAGWAQIPERNCMSNPMMDGCPMAESAKQTKEMFSKKPWWEEHPELLNPKLPGSNSSTQTTSTQTKGASSASRATTVRPAPADVDWMRPRLAKPLAPNWPRWTFAPADASALVGMKLSSLIHSPALATLLGPELAKQWQAVGAAAPPVDEVWISIRMLPGQKTEAVMLVMGQGVESMAADLWARGVTVCFLDKNAFLTGEWNAVNRALARVVAGVAGPMGKRAGELWANNDVWMIAGRGMVNQVLPPAKVSPAGAASLTGASIGMSLQKQIAVEMLLTAATPADTERLAASLSKSPDNVGLGAATVQKTAGGVSVRAALDPAQLPEEFRRQMADQIRPVFDMVGPPPAVSQATKQNAIVIQGLDDGDKVIPLPKQ